MRFKEVVPGLVYTHCVAQRTEIAILDSLKIDDKYLEKSNQNLSAIFNFCYPSPVHHKELKKISNLFGSKIRQFSFMKNIRWTGNRALLLTIIETNYEVLNSDLDSK